MAAPSPMDLDAPWYTLPKDEMGGAVEKLIDGYKTEQAGRKNNYIRNLELFERRVLQGFSAHSYYSANNQDPVDMDRLGLIRSAVSSAVANLYAPQKPKPQFQTLGATWATRRKAYKLDRICEGVINQRQGRYINVWAFMIGEAGPEAALQGCAPIKITADQVHKRVVHEQVPHIRLFVDPAEGREPQSLFEIAPIDKRTAMRLYPKAKSAIKDAKKYDWYGVKDSSAVHRNSQCIEIQYAWRLPLGPDEPGHWCAVIGGKVVDDGEWTAPAFPFVFVYWEPHRDGFWGSGIGDEGRRLAEDCGELDLRLYTRELLASGVTVYYRPGSVNPEDLKLNDAVRGVPVEPGQEYPQDQVRVPFSPMELDYLKLKVSNFWDALGISQVSAAARREQGIESGTAQMVLNDTKAGRQLVKSQRYEQAYVDLAHQYVWRLRELADDDENFAVQWKGKTLLRSYKFRDADVEDDDEMSITVAPSSALPHDPAGRQEMVQTMFRSGLISQETAKGLIGWPDLDSELNVENAEYEYVDSLIDKYLDADEETWSAFDYQAPEGFIMNKVQALRRFASAWFRARIDQQALPPDEQAKAEFNINLLARWIQELDGLMQPPAASAGASPAAAAPTPDMLAPAAPAAAMAPLAA